MSTQRRQQPARGVGVMRSGYNLPPIKLPGMDSSSINRLKGTAKVSGRKRTKPTGSLKNRVSRSLGNIPGRAFALQNVSMAASELVNSIQQNQITEENEAYWNTVNTIGSVVGGALSFVNPLLGAIAQPIVSGIGSLIEQGKKNEEKKRQEEIKLAADNNCSVDWLNKRQREHFDEFEGRSFLNYADIEKSCKTEVEKRQQAVDDAKYVESCKPVKASELASLPSSALPPQEETASAAPAAPAAPTVPQKSPVDAASMYF